MEHIALCTVWCVEKTLSASTLPERNLTRSHKNSCVQVIFFFSCYEFYLWWVWHPFQEWVWWWITTAFLSQNVQCKRQALKYQLSSASTQHTVSSLLTDWSHMESESCADHKCDDELRLCACQRESLSPEWRWVVFSSCRELHSTATGTKSAPTFAACLHTHIGYSVPPFPLLFRSTNI